MLSLATCRYSGADIEKVCTGAKRRAIEADRGYVTTHDIQKVIRDKQEGASSLDSWVLQASKTYIKSSKTITHRTGFMGWRKKKEKIEEQGKLTDGELKVYKPLISNIKSNLRWWWAVNCIRFIAQGM
jgi:SpoVK/Ycf46/Vps4 family AAA+-type ATPase